MTDDFLTCATNTVSTMQNLLATAERIKSYNEMFEKGETAKLSLALGNTTIYESDFKADCRGEMVKTFLKQWAKDCGKQFAECVCDLQTLLETEGVAE